MLLFMDDYDIDFEFAFERIMLSYRGFFKVFDSVIKLTWHMHIELLEPFVSYVDSFRTNKNIS